MTMQISKRFGSLGAMLLLSACSREPIALTLVTPIAAIDREIVTDLAELFGSGSTIDLSLTAERLPGEGALDAVLSGDADIALVSNVLPYRDGIATIIPLFPAVLHVGFTGDRDVTDVASLLRGSRVFAGEEGSASRMLFEKSVERFDVPRNAYTYVERPGPEVPIDVFVVFAPISADRLNEIQRQVKIRLYSNGSPDSIGRGSPIDATTLLNPYLRPFVIPVGTYGEATPEPILTVAVDQMLVARRDLSETAVYEFISELLRLRPALAARRPGLFHDLSGDFDASRSTFVLHAGAQAYLERSEPTLLERYSGIAEVAVTLLIALISASLGAMRIYKVRRKNRIDAYYSKVLAVRTEAEQLPAGADRSALVSRIKGLQDSAFEELVNEKLAANESFRIFITLSNDVLRQLGATVISSSDS